MGTFNYKNSALVSEFRERHDRGLEADIGKHKQDQQLHSEIAQATGTKSDRVQSPVRSLRGSPKARRVTGSEVE